MRVPALLRLFPVFRRFVLSCSYGSYGVFLAGHRLFLWFCDVLMMVPYSPFWF